MSNVLFLMQEYTVYRARKTQDSKLFFDVSLFRSQEEKTCNEGP